MIANMPEKTGKSLEEWKEVLKAKTFTKHSEAVIFLKNDYHVTYGFANSIALLSKEEKHSDQDLITNQYLGKEALFPIYQTLVEHLLSFGNDVKISPKKDSVSFIRKRQFTLIRPATKARIDLGLKLKGKPLTDRLENSGPFGTMCSHRVRITSLEEIDQELNNWLEEAYKTSTKFSVKTYCTIHSYSTFV